MYNWILWLGLVVLVTPSIVLVVRFPQAVSEGFLRFLTIAGFFGLWSALPMCASDWWGLVLVPVYMGGILLLVRYRQRKVRRA